MSETEKSDWPIVQSDINAAIAEFQAALPEWWFSIGVCHVSCDVSCGPDSNGRDAVLLLTKTLCDPIRNDYRIPATLAEALRDTMIEAVGCRQAALSELSTPNPEKTK
jgi:hypothetical protein